MKGIFKIQKNNLILYISINLIIIFIYPFIVTYSSTIKDKKTSSLNLVTTKLAEIPKNYKILDPIFSPDGKNFAYKARKGSKWFVVFNGEKSATYDKIYNLNFSSDSRYIVYGAKIGNEIWWITKKVKLFSSIK